MTTGVATVMTVAIQTNLKGHKKHMLIYLISLRYDV